MAIAYKADELNSRYLGEVELRNNTYDKLSLKVGGKTLTLLLDQRTYLPSLMRFQQSNPKLGKIMMEIRFSNWTKKEEVTVPYTQASYANAKKMGTAIIRSHSVN